MYKLLHPLEFEQSKNRRGGGATSGLYAFPRVGRSDPSLTNNLHDMDDNLYEPSLEDYEDLPKSEIKRANLITFPRVGRTDAEMRKWARLLALQQALEKRAGPTSGLWFGPRLGKRSVNNNVKQHANKGQNEEY
ncbi:cardio acceleratory peptide 2b-like [Teleopsis dalmanni]|uniref:cardio acceleratory peptide 2b-like n=2 Tax=Teleopsis dalmanni TaxID=139649 RepID=UPI0018CEF26D|nr:cardio acceleratory peptide 2b-like [Teleopsis dalmanni]